MLFSPQTVGRERSITAGYHLLSFPATCSFTSLLFLIIIDIFEQSNVRLNFGKGWLP